MAAAAKTDITTRPIRARVGLLVVCLLLLYVVLPQVGAFSESFAVLRQAHVGTAVAGLVLVIATYVAAACMYQLLALKQLSFARTLHVQAASAFANRILPVGLGGLTLNVQYLRHHKHALPQALAVVGTNNTLGMVGHGVLLVLAVAVGGGALRDQLDVSGIADRWYVAAGVAVAAVAVLMVAQRLRQHISRLLHLVWLHFKAYRLRPVRLAAALACSLALTLLYITIFYLSAMSVGMDIHFLQALIVFTAGIIIGTVTPTPGGLGGVEAGLVAGSVAYGFAAPEALAAALLYRLLTYWLPLIPGFIFFMTGRRLYS